MKSLNRISTLSSELPTIDRALFKGHQPSGLQSKYYESAPCNARKVQKPLKRKTIDTKDQQKKTQRKHLSLPSYRAPLLALGKKPTNHPFRKEHDLPNLHHYVMFHVNFQGCMPTHLLTGANKGRHFFACPRGREEQCDFFAWAVRDTQRGV